MVMAGLRPGRIDRKTDKLSYTKREFMRGVPGSKVVSYDIGAPIENFPLEVSLTAENECQIRHNALEAARVISNRHLEKRIGKKSYHLKIRIYPHQVLRMNPIASGHHADRFGDGMRRSFGKAIGTAARVKEGQKLMSVWVSEQNVKEAREALRKAGMKFPTPCNIKIENA
ncbi:MAG: 50S ribosomal protein L16 [Candidatus Methanofastidiosia archaeon]